MAGPAGAEMATAPPAVATAAASSVATCPEPTTIAPDANTPPPLAAPPATAAPPPAVAPPAPAPLAVALLPAPAPLENPSVFASKPIGPSGTSAARLRLTVRSSRLKLLQPVQSRMCRRAVALGRTPRSCAPASSWRITEQHVSLAAAASVSAMRARTSSDFTAGTETPSAAERSV